MEFNYKKFITEGKLHKEPTNENEAEQDYLVVNSDWKDFEGFIDNLTTELKIYGLHVMEDPTMEGSDQIGVIISRTPIDPQQVIDDSNAEFEDYSDDVDPAGGFGLNSHV